MFVKGAALASMETAGLSKKVQHRRGQYCYTAFSEPQSSSEETLAEMVGLVSSPLLKLL